MMLDSNVTKRQRQYKLAILVLMGSIGYIWLFYQSYRSYSLEVRLGKPKSGVNHPIQTLGLDGNGTERNKVVILMWTKYFNVKADTFIRSILHGRKCKSYCEGEVEVTLDRSKLDRAAAIVFHSYRSDLIKNDLPKTRKPDQLWVLFGKESPHLTPELSTFNGLFNWTMTYRHDSEIRASYGETLELDEYVPEEKIEIHGVPLDKWISGKTSLIVGVISKCHTQSRREDFIKLLKQRIPMDIYGYCGNRICHRLNSTCNHTDWWIQLASKYKFYFAAENSICVDYITEKFWRTLDLGLVPVVYGGGNYTNEAPPNSFIDVRDFLSHKELVQYLVYLNSSDEEYRKYFRWRSKYNVNKGKCCRGWCDLCKTVLKFKRKLEKNDDPSILANLSHIYSDLGRWWKHKPFPENEKRACSEPDFD